MAESKLKSQALNITTWVDVSSFSNSWVNYGGAYANAAYYKDQNGFVYLRGLIKSGTNAQTAFTLPAGYRPSGTNFLVSNSNGNFGSINVLSDGSVQPSGTGSGTWFSFEGVRFYAG